MQYSTGQSNDSGSRNNLALQELKTPDKSYNQISLYLNHIVIIDRAHKASALPSFNSQRSPALPPLQDPPKMDEGTKIHVGRLILTNSAESYPINFQQRVLNHKKRRLRQRRVQKIPSINANQEYQNLSPSFYERGFCVLKHQQSSLLNQTACAGCY